ncbi:MAG TPA: ribonuclease HI family protein [Tetragenococcus sp.]|nr:ribonuclease HI family protein [Tetragenococcus sp.]
MLKIHIDASTKGNPGPSGGGIIITEKQQQVQKAFALSILTNHQAEFAVFSYLLDFLIQQKFTEKTIIVYTDSQILVQTLEKNYSKNPEFQKYLCEIQEKLEAFPMLLVKWIPEKENKGADHLARQGLQKSLRLQNRRK